MKPRSLVVSAINLSEGGPLTVLVDCLKTAEATLGPEWQITALVHDKRLIDTDRIKLIEFPESRKSWATRISYEWFKFHDLFGSKPVDLWLSLHDITPRVKARRQAVYCHNPSPFYASSLSEVYFDPKFFVFNKLYMSVYKAFARRNYAVVVQSLWMRDEFRKRIGHHNIVVARPTFHEDADRSAPPIVPHSLRRPTPDRPMRFLYPALPRVFKNIEILCEAVKSLSPEIRALLELRLTLDGTENKWGAALARRYGAIPGIRLIGRQSRAQMTDEYRACDVVLFPSRLETWGLPITEGKTFGKPLLVADRPYAHETVGTYDNVDFIPTDDASAWASGMASLVKGTWQPRTSKAPEPEQPYAADWPALWRYLVEGL